MYTTESNYCVLYLTKLAGLQVTQSKTHVEQKVDLYNDILSNYKNVVTSFDLAELATRCVLMPVRDLYTDLRKKLIQQDVKEDEVFNSNQKYLFFILIFCSHFVGKSVQKKYKNLTSLLLNHEKPRFHYKIEADFDGILDRVKRICCVTKKTKLTTSANRRKSALDYGHKFKTLLTIDEIKDDTFVPDHLSSYITMINCFLRFCVRLNLICILTAMKKGMYFEIQEIEQV